MIDYQLRTSKRTKHLRLAVYGDGRVVVSAPTWLHGSVIERFLADQSAWVMEKLRRFQRAEPRVRRVASRKEYLAHKERALALVTERINVYQALYGLTVKSIRIRNQKTRWGSCSSKGNLSFNYRILHLTPREQDYVIVHELCHLREMNHSPRFWALVAMTFPDYRALRQTLRKRPLV